MCRQDGKKEERQTDKGNEELSGGEGGRVAEEHGSRRAQCHLCFVQR